MWYNSIPSLGLITICTAVPAVTATLLSWPLNRNWSGRDLTTRWKRMLYARDQRLTGVEDRFVFHHVVGLDGIPDEK